MLSVAVQKDISEYKPKILGKMSSRMLVCTIFGVGITVGFALWIWFILGMNPSNFGILLMLPSVPFWLMAFFKKSGLRFEKWLPKYLSNKFFDNYLVYRSWSCMYGSRKKQTSVKKNNKKDKGQLMNGYEAIIF